ncbi:MAG: hypothetical protein ABSD74_05585 [Rhizomicrobium sp.]|jgi:hypothetical protein
MRHWKLAAAIAVVTGIGTAWAGQVPNPINADNTIIVGDFLLGNGAQRVTDSGWSLVPMAKGGCNAALTATANDLLYSTSSGCALLPTANSSILATNGSGALAWATSLPGGIMVPAGDLPLPTSTTLGGLEAQTCAAHQWLDVIPTTQVQPSCAQPTFSDLSGSIAASQLIAPTTSAFGGIFAIACPSHQWIEVIPASGTQPTCAQPAITDISGISATSPLSYSAGAFALNIGTGLTTSGGNLVLATPTATTIGGVESVTCVSHQWINQVTTAGVHNCTQPAFSDVSGSIAASQLIAPTTSAFGGVYAISCPTHQWIDVIPTSGTQPACAQPGFADVSGSLALSQMAAQSADTVDMNASGSSGSPTAVAMPTSGTNGCAGSSNALTYNTATHAWGCNTISGGGGGISAVTGPGYVSGYYYPPLGSGQPSTESLSSTGTIYFFWIPVTTSQTFTKISIDVTTSGTGNCELGVFGTTAGEPGNLIDDSGNVSEGGGMQTISGRSIALSPPGAWVAMNCSASVSVEGSGNVGAAESLIGTFLGFSNGTTVVEGYKETYAYGAMPSSASSLTALTGSNVTYFVFLSP